MSVFSIAGVVLVFGLIMLASATAPIAQERFHNTYYFFLRQILYGVIPGVFLFFLMQKIPMRVWERSWKIMFPLSLILMVLVFIPGLGLRINGSLSWINLRFTSLQPAEIAKFTFLIFLSGWLTTNAQLFSRSLLEGFAPYFFYVAAVCGLLLIQPDLGTMLVFFITAGVLAFLAGAQMKHLGLLALVGVGAVGIMIAVAPYRLERIKTLLDPARDPLGSGYHMQQSMVAIGSGGFLGKGFGNSRQKFRYLPEVSADSIFAVIAEEMGFVISALLVAAYAVFVVKGYALARGVRSSWARYFILGTMTWIGVQTFLNLGAMLGLVPLTGLPLPLVSHGGSALMMTLASLGVVAAAVKDR